MSDNRDMESRVYRLEKAVLRIERVLESLASALERILGKAK